MREDLKLPPRMAIEPYFDEKSKLSVWWRCDQNLKCPTCINNEWCEQYTLLLYSANPIDSYYSAPCGLKNFSSSLKSYVLVGVCADTCMDTLSCPYCSFNKVRCKKHHIMFYANSYFEGNGICCTCLNEFRHENKMDSDEKVYMVKSSQGGKE